LGEQTGGLLTSMVLGERAVGVDPSIVSDFRTVGLSHLIAASGFNLTVVTAMSFFVTGLFIHCKRLTCLLALVNLLCFVGLAGLSASVLRAAIMCTLVLFAKCLNRSLHGLAALATAFLATIVADPGGILDPGCQLSYAATAGIMCATPA